MPLVTQSAKPRVILGLMTFSPNESAGARITSLDKFNEILDLLQARGYHEVDTARIYGDGTQEDFTRQADWKERGLRLATKVKSPREAGANSAAKVAESVEASFEALGTDFVDILYLHRADRTVPFAETLEAVDRLHKAGKFATFGVSNLTAFEVAEVVMTCKYNGWVRPTLYQGMYNCVTRNIEAELFPACRRYGLDIVAYNPMAGGLLSGKIKSEAAPASGRFSDRTGPLGATYRERYFRESAFRALRILEEATERAGLTMAEVALRWMVHHSKLRVEGGNDGVIIGASSVEQLGGNLDSLERGPLPEEVVRAVDAAWEVSRVDSVPYWQGELEYSYDTTEVLFGGR